MVPFLCTHTTALKCWPRSDLPQNLGCVLDWYNFITPPPPLPPSLPPLPPLPSLPSLPSLPPLPPLPPSTQTDHNLPSTLAPNVPGVTEDLGTKKLSVKTAGSSGKISEQALSEEGVEAPVKKDAAAYEEAKTYVFLEVELQNPLIAKRQALALATRYI